ncbi:hypothetical protein LZC95_27920 [Pendulispora brunnea]|uniref:Uncharacterized protein n=1 Tax=Pendulispora brunnea TaxID=2905690 RepID=A0ABZ2JZD3_9BACT
MEEQSATMPVPAGEGANAFWARLLHRWFIEYNPFYLCSATLVLVGTMIWSRGLAQEGSVYGSLGVAAVAELYAMALLGGAALLTRLGQRRPAVLLALLTVVYQGDLTLHTETCAYLGMAGAVASVIWFAAFVAKLRVLAWIFQIRASTRSLATAIVGALGLVLIPRVLPGFGPSQRSVLIGMWLFSLIMLHERHGITSLVPLDAWAAVVLRRVMRATWLIWLGLAGLHIYMWSTAQALDIAPFVPAMALVAVRWIRRESSIWLLVGVVFTFVAWWAHSSRSTSAFGRFVGPAALGRRTFSRSTWC